MHNLWQLVQPALQVGALASASTSSSSGVVRPNLGKLENFSAAWLRKGANHEFLLNKLVAGYRSSSEISQLLVRADLREYQASMRTNANITEIWFELLQTFESRMSEVGMIAFLVTAGFEVSVSKPLMPSVPYVEVPVLKSGDPGYGQLQLMLVSIVEHLGNETIVKDLMTMAGVPQDRWPQGYVDNGWVVVIHITEVLLTVKNDTGQFYLGYFLSALETYSITKSVPNVVTFMRALRSGFAQQTPAAAARKMTVADIKWPRPEAIAGVATSMSKMIARSVVLNSASSSDLVVADQLSVGASASVEIAFVLGTAKLSSGASVDTMYMLSNAPYPKIGSGATCDNVQNVSLSRMLELLKTRGIDLLAIEDDGAGFDSEEDWDDDERGGSSVRRPQRPRTPGGNVFSIGDVKNSTIIMGNNNVAGDLIFGDKYGS